uniref:Cyclic nucleotide-binding domain-containing protein n=2 Tax=Guillardia theta (strain CCMP2712) TaxID=905079 RepID=A0A0C3SIN2_GUITC
MQKDELRSEVLGNNSSQKSLVASHGSQRVLNKPSLRDLTNRLHANAREEQDGKQDAAPQLAKKGNMARVAMKVFAAVALGRKKKDDSAEASKEDKEELKLPKWDYLLNHHQSKLRKKVSKAVHKAAAISVVGKTNIAPNEFQLMKSLESTNLHDRIEKLLSIVRKFKFFQSFSEAQTQELASVAVLTTKTEGDFLFRQDEVPDAVYVMLSGRCN